MRTCSVFAAAARFVGGPGPRAAGSRPGPSCADPGARGMVAACGTGATRAENNQTSRSHGRQDCVHAGRAAARVCPRWAGHHLLAEHSALPDQLGLRLLLLELALTHLAGEAGHRGGLVKQTAWNRGQGRARSHAALAPDQPVDRGWLVGCFAEMVAVGWWKELQSRWSQASPPLTSCERALLA